MPKIIVNEALCNKCTLCCKLCLMGIIEEVREDKYPIISPEKRGLLHDVRAL